MKKTILILFAVAIASVNSLAQEPPAPKPKKTPEERADMMTKRLTKELALNEDQQVKTRQIILKRELEREKLANDMKAAPGKVKEEFKKILTAEQFQKFEAKEVEMKKKREERRKKGPPRKDAPVPPPTPEGK